MLNNSIKFNFNLNFYHIYFTFLLILDFLINLFQNIKNFVNLDLILLKTKIIY